MSTPDTKQKILDASLLLFNENGIVNVRLQQIADESGISVGNLAYHFNTKEAITESLIGSVIEFLRDLLRQYGKYPSLLDLQFFFKEFYRLYTLYSFFSCDILEIKRNYPGAYDHLQPLFNKMKLQLERRLDLYLQQRLLVKESDSRNMAANIWLLMLFMPAERHLNEERLVTENAYLRRLWEYLQPYLSPKGQTEFGTLIEPELRGR
jgi:AcrR family transcriptional regulator